MSSYDDLRRDHYQVDATRKAREQEAEELGRDGFAPDALRKAARQEAEEGVGRTVRRTNTRRQPASTTPASQPLHDQADRTVIRRTTPVAGKGPSGGAVKTKRSGLAAALRRRMRERQRAAEARERARLEEERVREPRRSGGVSWGTGALRGFGASLGALRVPLLLVGLIVVLYLMVLGPVDKAISFSSDESQGLSRELSWHVPGRPYYVLALGSDAREGEVVSRTDTMILVRVDTLGGKLTMLSIPRDTMVQIEGHGTQKINAAYAFGGAAGAARAVRELCGVPISHVAVIKFDGVESLVDYLGGVTVDVPVDVYDPEYTGLVLSAGVQEMDGYTALQFSRARHGFAIGDYQRQIDQRILIQAIMGKALSLSPLRLPGLVRHMGGLLSTSMRMYSILPLMLRLKVGGGATIYQATVPSDTDMIDGVSYVIADKTALAQMMDVIKAGGDPSQL